MAWVSHLVTEDKAIMDIQALEFINYSMFIKQKEEEEFITSSQYIQRCSSQMSESLKHTTWYFYCNRSGDYTPRSRQLRQMKSQGTNKIGQQRTAHMIVKAAKDTGHVTVNYCATHSHPIKLSHIKIPT